ncbi:MAG: 4-hydroxy-tetrahydrodipicolinate synthase [Saprospiraceae bacterium]|nr:4-hydroxy-tetrahydrodipicolinate synthase [Saprospiraceae bacterium]
MPDYSQFKGTGVALITPFNADGSIDYPSLENIIEHCVQGGVESLISMGTTGESVTLSLEEKYKIVQFTIDRARKRAQVIVGIGGNNTHELIDELKSLNTNGIDGILSSSPAYNKPSQEGIYQHYMALEKVSPLPIIIYNVPGRTSSNITAGTTIRLANASSKFAAIKEASGDLAQATQILCDRPNHFLVLSGDDPLALALVGIGGDGVISVIANAYPSDFSEMIRLSLKGSYPEAQKLNNKLFKLHKWLYIDGNPAGIKAACAQLNLCKNHLRLPLVPMNKDNEESLIKEMNNIV